MALQVLSRALTGEVGFGDDPVANVGMRRDAGINHSHADATPDGAEVAPHLIGGDGFGRDAKHGTDGRISRKRQNVRIPVEGRERRVVGLDDSAVSQHALDA